MGLSAFVSKVNPTTLILGGVVIGAGIYFVNRAANNVDELTSDIGNAVNITDDNNIINQGISKVVNDLTDGQHESLSSWAYCVFNPETITCDPNYGLNIQEQI